MTPKKIIGTLIFILLSWAIAHSETASWYETPGVMANGKPFDPSKQTCASWKFPLGSWVRVSAGGKSVVVKVTDRGPAKSLNRDIDLSRAAFEKLAPLSQGLIKADILPVIWLAWDFDNYTDTLEQSTDGARTWTAVPGPYSLNLDNTKYYVPVDGTLSTALFRVSRWWGAPNIDGSHYPR